MNRSAFKAWCAGDFSAYETKQSPPLVMGVLNLTPDSFSDGGLFLKLDDALFRAEELIAEGADLIDVGGVSSRPFSEPVSVQKELDRVMPFLECFQNISDTCISIDTTEALVMQAALRLGVGMLNDIQSFQDEKTLLSALQSDVPIVLMHMQGKPSSMQIAPSYPEGVTQEVDDFFFKTMASLEKAGILRERMVLDPGFGFGKTVENNLDIIRNFEVFGQHGRPVLLGVSRKSTIGRLLNEPSDKRLFGGLALSVLAAERGAAILRTHDVLATVQALRITHSVLYHD